MKSSIKPTIYRYTRILYLNYVGQFQVPVEQHEPTEEERIAAEKEAERLRRKRESNRMFRKMTIKTMHMSNSI